MEFEINGQVKSLKEMKYLDAVEVEEVRQKSGLRAATKKFLTLSGLTDEEVEGLSIQEGIKLQKMIGDFTQAFQSPSSEASE